MVFYVCTVQVCHEFLISIEKHLKVNWFDKHKYESLYASPNNIVIHIILISRV